MILKMNFRKNVAMSLQRAKLDVSLFKESVKNWILFLDRQQRENREMIRELQQRVRELEKREREIEVVYR